MKEEMELNRLPVSVGRLQVTSTGNNFTSPMPVIPLAILLVLPVSVSGHIEINISTAYSRRCYELHFGSEVAMLQAGPELRIRFDF